MLGIVKETAIHPRISDLNGVIVETFDPVGFIIHSFQDSLIIHSLYKPTEVAILRLISTTPLLLRTKFNPSRSARVSHHSFVGCHSPRHLRSAAHWWFIQSVQSSSRHEATLKTSRYANITDTNIFLPVAIETGGVCDQQAIEFMKELGKRISAVTKEPK